MAINLNVDLILKDHTMLTQPIYLIFEQQSYIEGKTYPSEDAALKATVISTETAA